MLKTKKQNGYYVATKDVATSLYTIRILDSKKNISMVYIKLYWSEKIGLVNILKKSGFKELE